MAKNSDDNTAPDPHTERFPIPYALEAVGVLAIVSFLFMGKLALDSSRLIMVWQLRSAGITTTGKIVEFGKKRGTLHIGKGACSIDVPVITFRFKDEQGQRHEQTVWVDDDWYVELHQQKRDYLRTGSPNLEGWSALDIVYLPQDPEVALPEQAIEVGLGNLIFAVILFAGVPFLYYVFIKNRGKI